MYVFPKIADGGLYSRPVVASSLSTPANARSQIVEVLRKVGIKDIPELGKPNVAELVESLSDEEVVSSTQPTPDATDHDTVAPDQIPDRAVPTGDSFSVPSEPEKQEVSSDPKPKQRKKRVSFTPDTKSSDASRQPIKTPSKRVNSYPLVFGPPTSATSESPSIKTKAQAEEEDSDDSLSEIVLPEEPPEDAALRRQMLKYGMEEVGSIVAQIDLDEGESTPPYSDDDDDVEYDDTTDEDEDQFGRTRKRVVGDDYREQMLELERELNAKIMENVGPNADVPVAGSIEVEEDRKEEPAVLSVAPNGFNETGAQKKKGVRFAESLEISHAPSTNSEITTKAVSKESSTTNRPIADSIVERTTPTTGTSSITSRTKKTSKFKAARSEGASTPQAGISSSTTPSKPLSNTQTHTIISNPVTRTATTPETQPHSQRPPKAIHPPPIPSGPLGKIQSKILIERPPPPITTAEPASPDEFDPALMHQELAVEYNRLRNRMIQRNGGFVQEEQEPAETPIVDEEEEQQQLAGGRKMSLFKASRLGLL